jgi:hypothetical protein
MNRRDTTVSAQLQVRGERPLTGELLPPKHQGLALELQEPMRRLLLDPARSIGRDDVEAVGVTEIPSQPIVRQTETGSWFFATDFLNDPGLERDGGIAVPEVELQRLRALRDAGVRPDLIWIAHELPTNWAPDQPLPELVPDPLHVRKLDETLERFVRGTAKVSAEVVRGVAIGLGVGVGLALAPIAAIGLDPVILAGVRHPEHPYAAWVKVAAWTWR